MPVYRALGYGDRLPESFVEEIQEFIGTYVSPNFTLTSPSSTTVKVAASTDNDQVSIAIDGRWRYAATDITASHPGGVAGTYDVYVTGSDNAFSGGEPETDSTVYAFALAVRATGSPPATALYRKVGTVAWNGTSITSVTQTVGSPTISATPLDLTARQGAAAQVLIGLVSGVAGIALGSAGDATITRGAGPTLVANVGFNAPGFAVSGTALAASHLSNGVTGSGAVVLAASPTFSGAPLSTTPAVDDNSLKVATTAFVLGQNGTANPLIDGTAAPGSSNRWTPIDHVHPTDTSRAALASPTFTGTPQGPTAAVDTSTVQLATTAFVLGQKGTATPLPLATTAAAGTSSRYSPVDHVHAGSSGHFVGESIHWHSLALPSFSSEVWGWTDGSAVSRATYAALLTLLTYSSSGTRTNGSKVITGLANTAGLAAGMALEGNGFAGGTLIQSVDSSSQITATNNAGSSGTNTVTVFPWGNGDGSTTFNVPDSRGRGWVGLALSGGHADVSGLGLTEGLGVTMRRAKHRHTNATAISGAPGVGSLVLPNHSHSDNIDFTVIAQLKGTIQDTGGSAYLMFPFSGGHDADESTTKSGGVLGVTSTPAITGAPSLGSLTASGLVGNSSSDSLDAAPYAVVGKPIRMA